MRWARKKKIQIPAGREEADYCTCLAELDLAGETLGVEIGSLEEKPASELCQASVGAVQRLQGNNRQTANNKRSRQMSTD